MNVGQREPPVDPRWARLLAGLRPDEFALRDRVAAEFDPAMLDEIAAADYGVDVDRHREATADLLIARWFPDELDWHPLEVLELVRWSEPDVPRRTGIPGRRGHLMRIFACLVLTRVKTPNGRAPDSLAPLIESALELGPPVMADALRYVAWCRLHEPGDWRDEPTDPLFLTFGVLLLAAATGGTPDRLGGLAHAFVGDLESLLVDEGLEWQFEVAPLLLGLRPRTTQRRMWRALAGRCLVDGAADTVLGGRLALLGEAVRARPGTSISDVRGLFTDWRG